MSNHELDSDDGEDFETASEKDTVPFSSGESDFEEDSSEEASSEEDPLVQKLTLKRKRKENCPPDIKLKHDVLDLSFSPTSSHVALACTTGDITMYKYGNEENSKVGKVEAHIGTCRGVEFSTDGLKLYSISGDKSIVISDPERLETIKYIDNAHNAPIHAISLVEDHFFATGDENGNLRVWDPRINSMEPIYSTSHKMTEHISDITCREMGHLISCCTGGGQICTYDFRAKKFVGHDVANDAEFTALCALGDYLVSGDILGTFHMYKWSNVSNKVGQYSPMKKKIPVNKITNVTDHIIATGWDDGTLRAYNLNPNMYLGNIGNHQLAVESIDVSAEGDLIASISHDETVRFWNISFLEDIDVTAAKRKKNDEKNLPSSTYENRSDFFSEMK